MNLADILRDYVPGSEDQPWSWDDEERSLHEMPCPTTHALESGFVEVGCVDPCNDPQPGCYQRKLEAHLAEVGRIEQPVCLGDDGRVWDGHHRIVAARRLGFAEVPVEDE